MELTVESVDLAIYGVTLQNPGRWRSAPKHVFERIRTIDRTGAIVRSTHEDAQLMEFPMLIDGADHAEVDAYLEKLASLLTWKGDAGLPADIKTGDRSGYTLFGHHVEFEVVPRGPGFITAGFAARWIVLVASPPAWVSDTVSSVSGITTSAVPIPQGSASPYNAVLSIFEPTDPVITLRDHNNVIVGDPMEITHTAGAGNYININLWKRTIYKHSSAVPDMGTEISCDWTDGDFLEFRPTSWWFVGGLNPTLAISSGTGAMLYQQARK